MTNPHLPLRPIPYSTLGFRAIGEVRHVTAARSSNLVLVLWYGDGVVNALLAGGTIKATSSSFSLS